MYQSDGPWADISPSLIEGCKGQGTPAQGGLKDGLGFVWGLLRGSPELISASLARGQPWVYIDHGYFHRGHYDGYYRFTLCDFQQRQLIDAPADRWEALGIRLKPWRKGKDIVVCPPSDHVAKLFGLEGWLNRTVNTLKQHTDRPIVVRQKSDPRTLLATIATAHCVVTTNSIAAVEAAVFGVPVFVDASSAASPIGRTDITKIESPICPEREAWVRSLAYGQYTRDEMKSGLPWSWVKERIACTS